MAKILVIDDEEMVRLTIRRTLEKLGHEVEEAENGRIGLEMQKANPADVIITDIIMPEQEGVETIIHLIKENPDTKIIAVSGGGRIGATDYLAHAKKYGAARVFEKPFDRKELAAAVEELVSA